MKFVCMRCEKYMAFQNVEVPDEGRLGITFACDGCGARFSMVTNPGETQLVSSLGVSLGGRTAPHAPLEMTRGALKGEAAAPSPSMGEYLAGRAASTGAAGAAGPTGVTAAMASGAAPAAGEKATGGGCPFSSLVRDMGLGGGKKAEEPAAAPAVVEPRWGEAADAELRKLPAFVRQVLKKSVEDFARAEGFEVITPEVMAASKRGKGGVEWSEEARVRLERIPDFVRPMARAEIEQLARQSGSPVVTGAVMDQARDVFGKMMGA